MKSFLTNLSARAHGLAEVVQPRSRALFESEPTSVEEARTEITSEPSAPARSPGRSSTPEIGPHFSERIVEVERLLAAAMPLAPRPTPVNAPMPTAIRLVVTPEASLETGRSTPAQTTDETATPTPAARPAAAPVIQPVVQIHRAALATGISPALIAVPSPAPAPLPAPPTVTIRIERIDVRAVPPAAPVARPTPKRPTGAHPSLDDYLAARR